MAIIHKAEHCSKHGVQDQACTNKSLPQKKQKKNHKVIIGLLHVVQTFTPYENTSTLTRY